MRDWWKEFLAFKKLVTPFIMPVLFWVGVAVAVIMGIVSLVDGARFGSARLIVSGIITLFLGPVFVRVLCELVLTFFREE